MIEFAALLLIVLMFRQQVIELVRGIAQVIRNPSKIVVVEGDLLVPNEGGKVFDIASEIAKGKRCQ